MFYLIKYKMCCAKRSRVGQLKFLIQFINRYYWYKFIDFWKLLNHSLTITINDFFDNIFFFTLNIYLLS